MIKTNKDIFHGTKTKNKIEINEINTNSNQGKIIPFLLSYFKRTSKVVLEPFCIY